MKKNDFVTAVNQMSLLYLLKFGKDYFKLYFNLWKNAISIKDSHIFKNYFNLVSALTFFSLSALICYITIYAFSEDFSSKEVFFIRFFLNILFISVFIYFYFLMSKKATFKEVLIICLYLYSLTYPLYFILSTFVFNSVNVTNEFIYGGSTKYTLPPKEILIYSFFLTFSVGILNVVLAVVWFKRIYMLKLLNSIFLFLYIMFIVGYLFAKYLQFINPYLLELNKFLNTFFNLI